MITCLMIERKESVCAYISYDVRNEDEGVVAVI